MSQLVDDAPAARAGLRIGDLNHTPVQGMKDLQALMVGDMIGAPTTFTVVRGDRVRKIEVVPQELAA